MLDLSPSASPELAPWPVYRNNVADLLAHAQRRPLISGLMEADVTETLHRIRTLQRRAGVGISLTAYLVYLLGQTTRRYPEMQAVRVPFRKKTARFHGVDVSTAVEHRLPGRGRLPVPYAVRDADRKSLAEICIELRTASKANLFEADPDLRLRARLAHLPRFVRRLFWRWVDLNPARRRRVRGTIGLSNLNGVTPFRRPGFVHAMTLLTTSLCVGALYDRLVPDADDPRGFRSSKRLCITLHCDHLLVDGAPMVRFAGSFLEALERGDGLDDELVDALIAHREHGASRRREETSGEADMPPRAPVPS
ncbi:MAG: 2-oxo acid dehydrogenase subunit E2 [Bacteroidota bacterium]